MAKRPRNYRKMPPLEKVISDLAAGMTPTMMEEVYNVGHSTVSHFLTKHGLTRPVRVSYPDDEVFLARMRQNKSIADMAAEFGMSRHSVRQRIIDRGLRTKIEPPPPVGQDAVCLRPGPAKVINEHGISIPRIPTIHGRFEART